MKKILFLASLMVFFSSAKAQKKFVVEGKINNYDGKVHLIYGKKSDSVYTKNGKFHFKGKTKFPVNCFITVPTEMDKTGITTFWIDEGKTLLELDTTLFRNSKFNALNVKGKVIESGKTNKLIDSLTSEIIKINT